MDTHFDVAKTGTALLLSSTKITLDKSKKHDVKNTAADLATAVISGVKSTSDEVASISKEYSPLSVIASILNTLEVEASLETKTLNEEETTKVVETTSEKHGRVASRKGGY